ncbi:ADPRM [Symbiodinium natans]|uniref:ADPRM protein n=1 Tax=Symbiodinium natans TaxID=878477 RepID=A0A812KTE1_9DINO|nr:ADPRM [Symbiodinium natans]
MASLAPFRLGLIADIQYADCADGTDFSGCEKRYFRNSLNIARNAVDCWNAVGVDAVVQLGDVIDGCNAKMHASETALATVLDVLSRSPAQRFDLIGNHELYNVQRESLASSGLRCFGPDGQTYYSAHLGSSWEAIFLDPYEISLIGMSQDDSAFHEATEMMRQHNPNVLTGAKDWFSGLPTAKHRYVPYNGGISQKQLDWLERALQSAEAEARKVLVFLHVPLFEPATKAKTVVWNSEEVLRVLHAHRDAVVAVFAGHDHDGGYGVDAAGIHHITMNSPLTAEPGSDCYAVLECHADGWAHFRPHGRACVESNTLGAGRAYPELILAKGSTNLPGEQSPGAESQGSLAELQAMGFSAERAKEAFEAAGGNMVAAVGLLCG